MNKVYIVTSMYEQFDGSCFMNIENIFSTEAAATHHCYVLREKNECDRKYYNVEEWDVE